LIEREPSAAIGRSPLFKRKEKIMKTRHLLRVSLILALLSGCATIQGSTDVSSGRQALFEGNYQAALSSFQTAAQTDPNYIYGSELREGVWSFLGRAQYLTGNYAQARQTLDRSLSLHRGDNVARLYLGLTLVRLGDRPAGLKDIQSGMSGISQFLNYITTQFSQEFGQFWDPSGGIRSSIKTDLAMISSGNIDWPRLLSDGEALGIRIEREEDLARQQEQQQREQMFQK
jgi:tetratricopeptide (TPR) repeat protein